ncbi:MAG: accessory factor UbiK family protein [Rhodospirillales bacterium]|nr:accessory factor UbiK family protein [Rhodospirillales bacterium]MCW8861754.1 accessory factor UbiK family protein [Rhodospirillales bacterium]MCW8951399.1 accessory factor UbiK family protein [Rhodospirillales bacterium]MCW8969934.1 accessory factor UbiK family protein [Rhodospirillales bacterium]MCW9003206.1 accessory factor UbiK family protein [Rhodospirillales bacterium]
MRGNNRLFDDIAKVTGGAAGALGGLKDELDSFLRQHLERVLSDMDLVPREEFEVARAMAAKARAGQEALEKRVAALEAQVKGLPKTTKKTAPKTGPKARPAD